jgi:hypothetical protein
MPRAVLLVCAFLSAGLVSGPADARSREQDARQEQRDDSRDERRKMRDGAADAGRRPQMRNGGGRVLSVAEVGSSYRVKVLKDGVVRVYYIEDN